MSRKPNFYKQILNVLEILKKEHPMYTIGWHISTALDGSDIWSVSDKDFLLMLTEYESKLNSDVIHDEDVENIIKQGMNLNHILDEDDLYED